MKNKKGKRTYPHFFHNKIEKAIVVITILALILVWFKPFIPKTKAAGLDAVTVTLSNEAVNAVSQVTVAFEVGNLSNGETIQIYLGEPTTGDEWQLNGVAVGDIACSDDGAGEVYTVNSVTAAAATLPMWTQITATTVGAVATTVTCLIGDGAPNPMNPNAADGFSIGVVTTEDSGAGIAYVGNANDVTVTVDVLPNLALTIDSADGTYCTTAAGVTSCDLGTVLTTTVATGDYDVNVGTNASSGATLAVIDDGNLRNGGDDIGDVVENNTVTAGTEGNGISVVENGVAWTEVVPFDDDDTPTTGVSQTVATTAGGIDIAGDDITITHRVAIDSTTKALSYTHIVTWAATANF